MRGYGASSCKPNICPTRKLHSPRCSARLCEATCSVGRVGVRERNDLQLRRLPSPCLIGCCALTMKDLAISQVFAQCALRHLEDWNGTTTRTCCLQDGLKLDLNRLARKGFVRHGANIGVRGITWTHSYWGEIASGTISADMPPKPKWMRWRTYHRYVERYDHYEDVLDYGCAALVARLTGTKLI
jgi:hypothetical protein